MTFQLLAAQHFAESLEETGYLSPRAPTPPNGCNRSFAGEIRTQAALPSEDDALRVVFRLCVSGHIKAQRVRGRSDIGGIDKAAA